MNLPSFSILALGAALCLTGCGDDGGDDGASGSNGSSGSGGSKGADDAGGGSGPTSFRAELQDPTALVAINDPHEIRVLDNATGDELGPKATSGPRGAVTIEDMPEGKVGFLVKGVEPKTIDTYQFNIDARAQDETLWVVAKSTATLVPTLAQFTADPTKTAISGAVYWVNEDGEEEKVGCATVEFAGKGDAGDIRYFADSNLPTSSDMRADTNPLNGRFLVGNAPVGVQSVRAMVGGKEVGRTTLPLFPRKDASDGEDNLCISNIYVDTDTNPTPKDCD